MDIHFHLNCNHRSSSISRVSLYSYFIPAALLLSSFIGFCSSEPSITYQISQLCEKPQNHFLSTYRKIDGAEIISKNERNLDCILTFQTHSILQRFMLRFEVLSLDCNDHLLIYDGAHAAGLHNFRLVLTAIKDSKHTCKDFRCTTKEFCISPDLLCDNVNHCEDGSDEAIGTLCKAPINDSIFGMTSEWIVVITICTLLMMLACGVGISICICRRSTSRNVSVKGQMASTTMTASHDANGQKHLNFYRPAVLDYLQILQRKLTGEIRPYCQIII
ncbi:hypothetical protein PVAND_014247 [Polypedilum vanderplanki]|uniref:CUB domain-containing protein n=1 Tax=Polypedilum vanderplanki TaxID=319348 RepID=A0A9J6CSJ6_POLVA|nr:hypothetical protein PVAND_014247 [Polypedilum vanderplanki]